jgi:hypothetical protein
MKPIYNTLLFFLVLWTGLLLLTFNRHIRREPNTYQSEIFADKAGYYVYLPATFIYNWNGSSMPDSIDKKTGDGFEIINSHIATKYPMGAAIMMAPIWLINHYFIANPNDGFSFSYTLISSIASTLYVLLGLFISYISFKKYTPSSYALLITACIFFSTNLFYYTIIETGMSHSFSFFWFSLLLFTILKIKEQKQVKYSDAITLGITVGFIILLRPINFIFCFPYFLMLIIKNSNAKSIIKELLLSTKSILLYLSPVLIFAPQLFYYKYISTVSAAYKGTGFPYLTNPKILEVLFAPENGLFLYAPVLFFILLSYIFYREPAFFIIPVCLLACMVIYTYSSWQNPELGCAFGHRSMVEFYSFLFLPLTCINMSKKIKNTFIFTVILSTLYTLKISLSYDRCFYGNNDWDWSAYLTLLFDNIK